MTTFQRKCGTWFFISLNLKTEMSKNYGGFMKQLIKGYFESISKNFNKITYPSAFSEDRTIQFYLFNHDGSTYCQVLEKFLDGELYNEFYVMMPYQSGCHNFEPKTETWTGIKNGDDAFVFYRPFSGCFELNIMDEIPEECHDDSKNFFRFIDEFPDSVTARNFESWLAVDEELFYENSKNPFILALQAPKALGVFERDFIAPDEIDKYKCFVDRRA